MTRMAAMVMRMVTHGDDDEDEDAAHDDYDDGDGDGGDDDGGDDDADDDDEEEEEEEDKRDPRMHQPCCYTLSRPMFPPHMFIQASFSHLNARP